MAINIELERLKRGRDFADENMQTAQKIMDQKRENFEKTKEVYQAAINLLRKFNDEIYEELTNVAHNKARTLADERKTDEAELHFTVKSISLNVLNTINREKAGLYSLIELAESELGFAKENFDKTVAEFSERDYQYKLYIEDAKMKSVDEKKEDIELAKKMGVPEKFHNRMKVVRRVSGRVDILFGGIDKPNGFGHGHYAMEPNGEIVCSRPPDADIDRINQTS